MRIFGENNKEIALANDQVCTRAICVAGSILGFVVRDRFRHLRKGFATNQLRADKSELDVGILPMGFVAFRVHEARSRSEESEMWRSLGMTVCWGLSFSTLITLVLIPAVYCVFATRQEKRKAKKFTAGAKV